MSRQMKTPAEQAGVGANQKENNSPHSAKLGTKRAWMRAHFLADQIGRYSPGPSKSQAIRNFIGAALFALRGGA